MKLCKVVEKNEKNDYNFIDFVQGNEKLHGFIAQFFVSIIEILVLKPFEFLNQNSKV